MVKINLYGGWVLKCIGRLSTVTYGVGGDFDIQTGVCLTIQGILTTAIDNSKFFQHFDITKGRNIDLFGWDSDSESS